MNRGESWAARVRTSLAGISARVEPTAANTWRCRLSAAPAVDALARVDDCWLFLEVRTNAGGRAWWEMLSANAALPGGAKFAHVVGDPHPRLRAELALDDDVALEPRVAAMCSGLVAGLASSVTTDAVATATPVHEVFDLAQRCADSGWEGIVRSPASVAVELAVPDAFVQAVVTAAADGSVHAAVDLGDSGALHPLCRHALGLLLLRVCGSVRLVRAAVLSTAAARLEVLFATPPSATELAHAFAALSVAYRSAGSPAAILRSDETVAREFLHLAGHGKTETYSAYVHKPITGLAAPY